VKSVITIISLFYHHIKEKAASGRADGLGNTRIRTRVKITKSCVIGCVPTHICFQMAELPEKYL